MTGRADGETTLRRITVAEELTAEMRALGDRLIGYYVELARAEAHARRLRHNAVGTEHLLLGILDDTGTVAAKALRAQGADAAALRAAVEQRAPAGQARSPEVLPVGPAARRALEASLREALEMGHNYIGTEHLLLALLHDTQAGAGGVLAGGGVTLGPARSSIQDILSGYLRRQA